MELTKILNISESIPSSTQLAQDQASAENDADIQQIKDAYPDMSAALSFAAASGSMSPANKTAIQADIDARIAANATAKLSATWDEATSTLSIVDNINTTPTAVVMLGSSSQSGEELHYAYLPVDNTGAVDRAVLMWNGANKRYEPEALPTTAKATTVTRANANTWVTCGSVRFMMAGSGNRSFRVSSASGTISVKWATWAAWPDTRYNGVTNSSSPNRQTLSTSSNIYLHDNLNMGHHNDKQSGRLYDLTNNRYYMFDLFVGYDYNNNVFFVREI